MPLVIKSRGWIRARSFERVHEGEDDDFLVVHKFENPDWQTSPEFCACMERAIDWMGKNLDEIAVKERRILQRLYVRLDRKYIIDHASPLMTTDVADDLTFRAEVLTS